MLSAIIVSCATSLRQLFVTSQNHSSSGRAAYQSTYDPILKKSKEAYNQDELESVGDIQASTVDEVPMSPLNIVHVRQEYEIARGTLTLAMGDGKSCKHKTSFD